MEGNKQVPETKPYRIKISLENGLQINHLTNKETVANFLEFLHNASGNDLEMLDFTQPNGDLLLLSAWHLKRAIIRVETVKQD